MSRNDELYHHGVKGMKWGVRKDKPGSGNFRQRSSEKLSVARNYTGSKRSDALTRARRKNINKMSNQELQEEITRLNLERQYRSLTRVDFMRGQKHAENALKYEKTYKAVRKSAASALGKSVVGV